MKAKNMKARKKNRANFRIRPGTVRDVSIILRMIRELAEYERLADQVKATERVLRRHGFGRNPYFKSVICERIENGKPKVVGYGLYFFTYSTFLARPSLYLEDLYVIPEERGKGAGKALLSAMARIAVKNDCGRMEWVVIDFNEPAIRFYKRIGARLHKEWILTRLTGAPLRHLAAGR